MSLCRAFGRVLFSVGVHLLLRISVHHTLCLPEGSFWAIDMPHIEVPFA